MKSGGKYRIQYGHLEAWYGNQYYLEYRPPGWCSRWTYVTHDSSISGLERNIEYHQQQLKEIEVKTATLIEYNSKGERI